MHIISLCLFVPFLFHSFIVDDIVETMKSSTFIYTLNADIWFSAPKPHRSRVTQASHWICTLILPVESSHSFTQLGKTFEHMIPCFSEHQAYF